MPSERKMLIKLIEDCIDNDEIVDIILADRKKMLAEIKNLLMGFFCGGTWELFDEVLAKIKELEDKCSS